MSYDQSSQRENRSGAKRIVMGGESKAKVFYVDWCFTILINSFGSAMFFPHFSHLDGCNGLYLGT